MTIFFATTGPTVTGRDFDRLICLHDEDELSLLSGLHGFGGRRGSRSFASSSVSEAFTNCPGQRTPSRLSKVALRRMVPVCGSTVLSMTESVPRTFLVGIVLRRNFDGQFARAVLADGGELPLGHSEADEDRRDLVDHDDGIFVVGADQIAGVDEQDCPRVRRSASGFRSS